MAISFRKPQVEYTKVGGGRKAKQIELFSEFDMKTFWKELKDNANAGNEYIAVVPADVSCTKTILSDIQSQDCFTREQADEFCYLLRQSAMQNRVKVSVRCPQGLQEIHIKLNDEFVARGFQYE